MESVIFQEPILDNRPILTITADGTLTSHVADLEQRAEVLNALTSARTLGGRALPGTVKALAARQALQAGAIDQANTFVSDELGLWSGWREPVTTALMGPWAAPLLSGGSLSSSALESPSRGERDPPATGPDLAAQDQPRSAVEPGSCLR